MKGRVITAIVLLSLLLSVCILGLWNGKMQYDRMTDLLRQTESLAPDEDFSRLENITQSAIQQWEVWQPIGALYLHHDELESIEKELSEMEISLRMHNRDEFRLACHVALQRMEHIYITELPTLANLL